MYGNLRVHLAWVAAFFRDRVTQRREVDEGGRAEQVLKDDACGIVRQIDVPPPRCDMTEQRRNVGRFLAPQDVLRKYSQAERRPFEGARVDRVERSAYVGV